MKKVCSLLAALTMLTMVVAGALPGSAEDTQEVVTRIRPMVLSDKVPAAGTKLFDKVTNSDDATYKLDDKDDYNFVSLAENTNGTEADPAVPMKGTVSLSMNASLMPFNPVMFKLDSTAVEEGRQSQYGGDGSNDGDTLQINYKSSPLALKDGKGILLYVKLPKTSQRFSLWFLPTNSGSDKMRPDHQGEFWLLPKGGTEWVECPNVSGAFWQEAANLGNANQGFEGYIYLPKSTTEVAGDTTDWATDTIGGMKWKTGRYGGEAGALYISAPMIALTDPTKADDACKVMLEGETTVKNIFTGKDFEDPVPPTVIDEVAYMEEIPFMDPAAGYTVDKAIVSSESGIKMDGGKAGITIPDDFDIKTVANPNELGGYNALYVNSPKEITGNVWSSGFVNTSLALTIRAFTPLKVKNAEDGALMFYVKMPKAYNGSETSKINITLKTNGGEGGTDVWPEPGSGPIYLLAKNTTKWETSSASNTSLSLPSEFEGWVRVPWSTINRDAYQIKNNEIVSDITLYIPAFGGSMGAFTMSSLMQATNGLMTKDGAVINNSGVIQNLFTGKEMALEDVLPDPLKPGDVVTELPGATDESLIINEPTDITENSAKLTWVAAEGAASYKLDIYEYGMDPEGAMQYVYRASQTSETTSATITGLTAGARYAVLVTALDEAGKKLGVYEYRSFYTEDNGGWEPGPTDSDVSDDPDVSGEDGGNGDDGSGGAATGETFGGVAAALVLGLLAAGAALRLRVKH